MKRTFPKSHLNLPLNLNGLLFGCGGVGGSSSGRWKSAALSKVVLTLVTHKFA